MAARDWSGNEVIAAPLVRAKMLQKLSASGLTEADAARLGAAPLTSAEVSALRFWKGAAPVPIAFQIPYLDPWTGLPMLDGKGRHASRVRCLTDPLPEFPPDKDGERRRFNKYTQPFDSLPHAYFPPGFVEWPKLLTDAAVALTITEGELKAACATKNGFPTVGLGGVWLFMSKRHGYLGLLPELERVTWEDRRVNVAFDSDIVEKPDVVKALRALTARLVARGARVFRVDVPAPKGGGKAGVDDFIVERGAEAFAALLEAATELESWQAAYAFGRDGPLNNLANALIAVSSAPEVQDAFAYDLMARDVAVTQPLFDDAPASLPRPRTDDDVNRVRAWLQRDGGLSQVGATDVSVAIDTRARERPFHPIREYLRSLRWDGRKRLDGWLARYLGVAESEYASMVGAKFLISMVARVERPGCKVDHALMLIGEQGDMKSTACRVLSGDPWFSDQLPHLSGHDEKRLSQHLRGKWLIEIAELSALKNAEIEDVKKFVTRQTEKYLPSYGRHEAIEDRQCVFVATTNEDMPLKDETGDRRWWPVNVGVIDVEGLRRARDQLMAEAFARYAAGEEWWFERSVEKRVVLPEQKQRFAGGAWDDAVEEFLEREARPFILADPKKPDLLRNHKVKITYVAMNALSLSAGALNRSVTRGVGLAMRRVGWTASKSHGIGYFSPTDEFILRLKAKMEGENKKDNVVELPKKRGPKY